MKNYKIVSVTYFESSGEFRIRRRHVVTGKLHITTANNLISEEIQIISENIPICDFPGVVMWVPV